MGNVIEQWNHAARKYADDQEQSEYAQSNKYIVTNRFSKMDGEKVLDLGCGYGFYTNYFRDIGGDVVGVDGSEVMIQLAKQRYPDCKFAVADITKPLTFADGTFDLMFCNQVLMDIEDVESVFVECNRLLKQSGTFYYAIVHPAYYDCHWLKDEKGFRYAKVIDKYISHYHFANEFWGETMHYHRPLSYYLNLAATKGFTLVHTEEPSSYDGTTKNSDLPLFFFAEYKKQ